MFFMSKCRNVALPERSFRVICQTCFKRPADGMGTACAECRQMAISPVYVPPPSGTVISARPEIYHTPTTMVRTQGGVHSQHAFAGNDAAILDEVEATVTLLERMADRIRSFVALDDETRRLVKATKSLAADMQNEVDRRKGK